MRKWFSAVVAATGVHATAAGHFLYVTPNPASAGFDVVFNDTPTPDPRGGAEAFDKLRLQGWGNEAAGRDLAASAPSDGVVKLATELPVAVGSSVYGVVQRGDGFPVLLTYHAKAVRSGGTAAARPVGLPLELTPVPQGSGGVAFLATENGKPMMGQEVLVLAPGEALPAAVRTGPDGLTPLFAKPGNYAARAYRVAPTAGEHDGRKYQATRQYTTLTLNWGEGK